MKKFLSILFAVVMCVPIAILAASCGGDETPTLESLLLDTTNAKTEYYIGEDFSSAGLVVKAKYSDDTEITLKTADYKLDASAYKKTEAGSYEIKVSYKEKSEKYTVTVEETPLALAKRCLDAWDGDGYWINNVFMTSEYYKDSKKVGDLQVFASYGLQYGKAVDYTEDKSFLASIDETETEQWVVPFYDNDTNSAKYISYDLVSKNKKTCDTLSEAIEETMFQNRSADAFYWYDDYLRKLIAAVLFVKDPSLEVDPEYTFVSDDVEVDLEVRDSEINVTYGMKGEERKETATFDRGTFVLKSWSVIKISELADEFHDYYNCCYYFNYAPTQRMKTPPTNVNWIESSSKEIVNISLDTTNAKTEYYIGEDFSSAGLVVTGVYDDESKKVLEEKDYSINSRAFKKQVGSYEIVVSFGEITARYTVEVKSDLDIAKMCLDNWSENSNWVKNALKVESYIDNGQEIAKVVDYCDENSLYDLVKDDSVDKKVSEEIGDCGERWITPDFVGYFLSENTKTKKAYNSMLEAITDTELGFDLQSFRATVDSYIKQTFDLCVSMQDPDFVFSEERYPDLGPIEIEVGIKYYFTDTELQITFYEETGNSRNVYIFDRDTLQLKCNAMLHGDACIDSLPNCYYNIYFYFNTTPTERMTTPPTDVQWTELN